MSGSVLVRTPPYQNLADPTTRECFQWMVDYVNSQALLQGNFKHYEIEFTKDESEILIPHHLGFVPKDIIRTSLIYPHQKDKNRAEFYGIQNNSVTIPHNTNTSMTFTQIIKTGPGSYSSGVYTVERSDFYNIKANIAFNAFNGTGPQCSAFIFIDNNVFVAAESKPIRSASGIYRHSVSTRIFLSKNQNIRILAYQNNGASGDMSTQAESSQVKLSNLSISGELKEEDVISFNYDKFTKKDLSITTTGPCVVRFFAGRYTKDKV